MTASAPRPPLIPFVPRDFLIAPVFTATPQTEPRTLTINNVKWAIGGCTPKPSKIPSKWISDFHSLVQPSFADISSIFTATIPFVAEELRSIDRSRCGAGKPGTGRRRRKAPSNPQNYGFDPIRPRNVMANCLTEFSRVWAYNPFLACRGFTIKWTTTLRNLFRFVMALPRVPPYRDARAIPAVR